MIQSLFSFHSRDRRFSQDLEHRVVLDERDRQLHHLAEEEREDRAASTGLGLEGIGIREGPVVEAPELGHPVGVSMCGGGSKADGAPLLEVSVDLRQVGLEMGAVSEQPAVVLDAMEADLAPACPDLVEESARNLVSLGNEVPRRDEAVSPLHLEYPRDVRDAGRPFDIVGEDHTELAGIRPEVDQRYPGRPRLAQLSPELVCAGARRGSSRRATREMPYARWRRA